MYINVTTTIYKYIYVCNEALVYRHVIEYDAMFMNLYCKNLNG